MARKPKSSSAAFIPTEADMTYAEELGKKNARRLGHLKLAKPVPVAEMFGKIDDTLSLLLSADAKAPRK